MDDGSEERVLDGFEVAEGEEDGLRPLNASQMDIVNEGIGFSIEMRETNRSRRRRKDAPRREVKCVCPNDHLIASSKKFRFR